MQGMRFQAQNIFILEKHVQYCGKIIPRSKKKVKWLIKYGSETHTVQCIISFYSGKKKVTHNGFTIMDVENPQQCLDCMVLIGDQKMIFMVDEKNQLANVERKFVVANDEFLSFNNLYSQPIEEAYEKYFGKNTNQF